MKDAFLSDSYSQYYYIDSDYLFFLIQVVNISRTNFSWFFFFKHVQRTIFATPVLKL